MAWSCGGARRAFLARSSGTYRNVLLRRTHNKLSQHQYGSCFSSLSSSSSNNDLLLSNDFLDALKGIFSTTPPDNNNNNNNVTTNAYELQRHGKGESYHPSSPPAAICTPTSLEEVVEVVKLCNAHDVCMIPFGAGTSLEGHVSALRPKTLSIDMGKFNSVVDDSSNNNNNELLDPFVTVQAGMTRNALNEHLRHTGMQFMVDPGADATIGGMISCGASGTTAVCYGTMRENVLGLECVLADGTVARCGTLALKSSAGYDVTSLMTGSEGTLGIITQATVKVHPIPSFVTAAICVFDDLTSAASAVATMKFCGVPLVRCELLDTSSVAAFNQYTKSNKTEKPTLFLEFAGSSQAMVDEQVYTSQSICVEEYGAADFSFTTGEAERKSLWAARHQLYYAAIASRPGAERALVTDACVPLSKFSEAIAATARDVEELGVVGPCFGHAGDGNFHCILPMMQHDEDEEYLERLHQVNDRLIQRTLEAGGTCTGEHGVGYGKIKYLKQQYGEGTVHMMKMIKKGLDPKNLMNPGKIVEL